MDTVVNEGGDAETTKKYDGPTFNPPVTRSYVTKARIHNVVNGPGADVEKEFHSRESTVMSRDAIRMAVDFLTSEEVQQTVAFGTLTMKGPDNLSREDKTIESAVPFPAPEKGDNRGLSPFHPRMIIVVGECPLLSPV